FLFRLPLGDFNPSKPMLAFQLKKHDSSRRPMVQLAQRTRRIDSSGIRKVFALAADLKDPCNLSIGQPDFDVPEAVKEVAISAIQEGKNSYTLTAGITPLREKIKERYAPFVAAPGEALI